MKTISPQTNAFSRLELVVLIAMMALLTALLVRGQAITDNRPLRDRIGCVSNLKQIGLAFRMWSNDHDDKFPMQFGANKEGSQEAIAQEEPWRHYVALSNELTSPKVLACPADTRVRATNFLSLSLSNVSYFVGLDADETLPQSLLSGDRNVTNGVAPKKTVLDLPDQPAAGWTEQIHRERGNLGLADGSAQQTTTPALRRQIAAANASNKIGLTRLQIPGVSQ
ncbi:MAG: hypothetical protein QOF48_2870 [Verrucomicrobiota bacterium]|jgi:hypothetical protein